MVFQSALRSLRWLLPLLALFALGVRADSLEMQRALFREAMTAAGAGDLKTAEGYRQALADYPLLPYLDYALLRRQLQRLDEATFDRFARDAAGTPLPDALREEWLRYLAARKDWRGYLAQWRKGIRSDELQCHHRRALLETGARRQAFAGLEQLWIVPRSQHKACDPVFRVWLKSDHFSENFAWQRFWLALDAGNLTTARYAAKFVRTPALRAEIDLGIRYYRNPRSLLKLSSTRLKKLPPPVRRIASERLASRYPETFLKWWQKTGLKDARSEALARRAAKRLLARYDDNALVWAERVDPDGQDEALLELRLRNQIARADWSSMPKLIDQLPPAKRHSDRWRYWLARSEELAHGKPSEQALALYRKVAANRSFYGFLAADRLERPYRLNHRSEPAAPEQLEKFARLPGLVRARELFHTGFYTEARREWYRATSDLPRADHYALGQLARSWGWYAQGIRAAIRARRWDDLVLRFPLLHADRAVRLGDQFGIPPEWILATIRQESSFAPDARSPAGAMGLMQLMPATARQTARKQQLRYANRTQLFDPEFNLRLGSAYLAELYRRFDGHRALASAAYNAGYNRIDRWLKERGHLPLDAWIETIPFRETRGYVQSVLSYALIYADLTGRDKEFLQTHEQQPLHESLEVALRD